jgi:hypothetical protein
MVCMAAAFLFAGQTALAAAVNDNCADAIPIGNVTNQAFNTTGSTHDGYESYCHGNNIWYCYTATCTGTVTVSLCGTEWDTMLAVYNGCECPATQSARIASNDDDYTCNNTFASRLTFNAVCGNQYLIEVGHYYQSVTGTGVITIVCSGSPCTQNNDNIANAEQVGNVVDKIFNTSGATFDGPGSCNIHHSPNIWYRYTATCTGQALISLCGSSFDTVLSVYSGTSINNLTLVGCNDNACGQQSQLTINVTAGKNYWIEVCGFYPNDVGQGKLNISCNGQVTQASDLGDAPDSTNHEGRTMKTYGGAVTAHFPTCYQGNAPYGPIHFHPKAVAYLGNDVTFEDEADTGYDQDPTHNIIPTETWSNSANRDLGDDCVVNVPIYMNHCKLTSFDYRVYIIDPNVDMYVNVWIDWNRDGDWNDDGHTDENLRCTTCNSAGFVSEWCVQNQLLYHLPKGLNTITTPGFLAWYPEYGDMHAWMRIMLSNEPWKGGSGASGSGPADGYEYGETEDYYITPNEGCVTCEDLNRDGEVDVNDLVEYMISWLNNCNY